MNIQDYVIPRPLSNAQARQGIALMEKQNNEQTLETLRDAIRLQNVAWHLKHGDLRK